MDRSITQPPTADAVRERLSSSAVPPTLLAAAALHLAAPTHVLVGMHIQCDDSQWTWGEATQAAPRSLRPGALAGAAVAFVEAHTATQNTPATNAYLDLAGHCLKPVRSGAYHLLGGSFLYGAPEILVAPDIADPAAVAMAWIRAATTSDAVGIVDLEGGTYLVHGDDRVIAIHSTTSGNSRADIPQWDVETVQALIADLLSLERIEAASIGSRLTNTVDVDYVGELESGGDRYEIIIPSTIGAGLVLGAPHGAAVPEVGSWYQGPAEAPWDGLVGYDPIEPARFEPGWVARHRASGVCVIVRREAAY